MPADVTYHMQRARSRIVNCDVLLLAVATSCKHHVSMPHVLVRDVPDDVHAALQRKAEHHHQSLQQYLTVELRHLAERRSISEVLDEVEVQHGGQVGFAAAVTDLDEERSQR
jgi:plasmid stability protein